ncbi:MAG: hypothetical protein AAGG72_05745, partial [Pseudomonadota bacterium]
MGAANTIDDRPAAGVRSAEGFAPSSHPAMADNGLSDGSDANAARASRDVIDDDDGTGLEPSRRMTQVGLYTVIAALVSAFATFLILTGLTPIVPRNEVVLVALFLNVLLIVAIVALLAQQAAGLWRAWREKRAGARLHIRIVVLFSLIAAIPAILLAVSATVSFSRSLDSWFSDRIRTIIEKSVDVARTYVDEHGRVIRTDAVNMARDLSVGIKGSTQPIEQRRGLVMSQAGLRE